MREAKKMDVVTRYSCPECGNLEATAATADAHYRLVHPKCRQDDPHNPDGHFCFLFAGHDEPHECACGQFWLSEEQPAARVGVGYTPHKEKQGK